MSIRSEKINGNPYRIDDSIGILLNGKHLWFSRSIRLNVCHIYRVSRAVSFCRAVSSCVRNLLNTNDTIATLLLQRRSLALSPLRHDSCHTSVSVYIDYWKLCCDSVLIWWTSRTIDCCECVSTSKATVAAVAVETSAGVVVVVVSDLSHVNFDYYQFIFELIISFILHFVLSSNSAETQEFQPTNNNHPIVFLLSALSLCPSI